MSIYQLFILDKSANGDRNISCDELYQKLKHVVIHSAHLTNEEAKDKLIQHLSELYPQNNCHVFIWGK